MTDKTSHWSDMLDLAESSLSNPRRTLELCAEVLSQPPGSLPTEVASRAHYLAGFSHRILGDLADAEPALLLARDLARSVAVPNLVPAANRQLGALFLEVLKTDLAIETLSLSAAQFAEQGQISEQGFALFSLSNAYWRKKDESQAMNYLERAMTIFAQSDNLEGLTAVHFALVNFALDRGKYDVAIERINSALRTLPESVHPKNRIYLNLSLAQCYLRQQNAERALSVLSSAILKANEDGYALLEARGLMLQYHAFTKLGSDADASECKLHAEVLARKHGFESVMEEMLKP